MQSRPEQQIEIDIKGRIHLTTLQAAQLNTFILSHPFRLIAEGEPSPAEWEPAPSSVPPADRVSAVRLPPAPAFAPRSGSGKIQPPQSHPPKRAAPEQSFSRPIITPPPMPSSGQVMISAPYSRPPPPPPAQRQKAAKQPRPPQTLAERLAEVLSVAEHSPAAKWLCSVRPSLGEIRGAVASEEIRTPLVFGIRVEEMFVSALQRVNMEPQYEQESLANLKNEVDARIATIVEECGIAVQGESMRRLEEVLGKFEKRRKKKPVGDEAVVSVPGSGFVPN